MNISNLLRFVALGVVGATSLVAEKTRIPDLEKQFLSPPDAARPGVYWYFMDGNQNREAMTIDLEAMHRAGLRKAVFLEVNVDVPRGPVNFMSEEWQENFAHAVRTADRLGMEIILGTGPGWSGSGGPWIDPARSMQHLRSASVQVTGPGQFKQLLPVPAPRQPSAFAGLSPELSAVRDKWYADVAVLAFPTPRKAEPPAMLDLKALYETQPYSSWKHVPRFVPSIPDYPDLAEGAAVDPARIVDLTKKMRPDGSLDWMVPDGDWTVVRFVARNNSATTRPAPLPGHGFECCKFSPEAFEFHFENFHRKLMQRVGPRRSGRGWTALHLDSWEMSSQNWSPAFRREFKKRRGYDPQPFFPAYSGYWVGSSEVTERFLWDLRKTAQELVIENHAMVIRRFAHDNGFYYSNEPYDMNPAGDLDLGAVADVVGCEFWANALDTVYSCIEAASIAHTTGRPVVRAESFTSMGSYEHSPARLKNQTDWAFSIGINDIIFHTYQHQPLGKDGPKPGMAMGPFGINWHRNQTFWPMVRPYHDYIARCGQMLRQGAAVADILYLTPEGAPHIFLPPEDAMLGNDIFREKKGYGFDAVGPGLLKRAVVDNGRIVFSGASSYRLLVLPTMQTMTPELLERIDGLVRQGATVLGNPPRKSPSLAGFPQCDARVASLAARIWGGSEIPSGLVERKHGKGRIFWGSDLVTVSDYPSYERTVALLRDAKLPPSFESNGPLRYCHRQTPQHDIFFVSNREPRVVDATAVFRADGGMPELWDPVTATRKPLASYEFHGDTVSLKLRLEPHQSGFVLFDRKALRTTPRASSVDLSPPQIFATLDLPYEVSFDPTWGGPRDPVRFEKLVPWQTHAEEAIRFYSGEAVYRGSFKAPAKPSARRLFLDLGVVHQLARVKLNGQELGIVWTPPYRLDVTGKLRDGDNNLEVTVANTWVNRMIGDQQPANKEVRELVWKSGLLGGKPWKAGRYTFSTAAGVHPAGSPLQESGLLGPVTLQAGD